MSTVFSAESVLDPCSETRSLIIEEETTIAHSWLTSSVRASLDGKILMLDHRHIHPVVPRRNTNLLRQFIDTIDSASHVATCNHKSLINTWQRVADHSHYILLNLTFQLLLIELLSLDELLDIWAFHTTHNDTLLSVGSRAVEQLSLLSAHSLEVLLQILNSNQHSFLVIISNNDTHRL